MREENRKRGGERKRREKREVKEGRREREGEREGYEAAIPLRNLLVWFLNSGASIKKQLRGCFIVHSRVQDEFGDGEGGENLSALLFRDTLKGELFQIILNYRFPVRFQIRERMSH